MKYKILLVLMIISLLSSMALSFERDIGGIICKPGTGCDTVNSSSYAHTFGIKNSYYGVFLFAIASIIIYLHTQKPTRNRRHIIYLGVALASIIALYFLYLQAFIIKIFCTYCLIVDTSMILSAIILMFDSKNE